MSRLNHDLRTVSKPIDMEVYDGKPVEFENVKLLPVSKAAFDRLINKDKATFNPVSAEGLVVTEATLDEYGEAVLIQLQKGKQDGEA